MQIGLIAEFNVPGSDVSTTMSTGFPTVFSTSTMKARTEDGEAIFDEDVSDQPHGVWQAQDVGDFMEFEGGLLRRHWEPDGLKFGGPFENKK